MPWPIKISLFGRGSNRVEPKPQVFPDRLSWWRHKKRGSSYEVIGRVRLQCSTIVPKDGDLLVLYVNEDGHFSARLPEEFLDGRFERLW